MDCWQCKSNNWVSEKPTNMMMLIQQAQAFLLQPNNFCILQAPQSAAQQLQQAS
jgi:hypothetical protein